jgi:hypothetical protein
MDFQPDLNMAVLEQVTGWTNFITAYAVTLAATGALAMALLEAFKRLLGIRVIYHQRALKQWLSGGILLTPKNLETLTNLESVKTLAARLKDAGKDFRPYKQGDPGFCHSALRQIIARASGLPAAQIDPTPRCRPIWGIDSERTLYNLSLEKMMGQLQEAADVVLDNPQHHLEAYLLLTNTAAPDDVDQALQFAMMPHGQARELDDSQREYYAGVSNRIQQAVQRQLDSFQLRAGHYWASANQYAAVILGAVLLFVAIYLSVGTGSLSFWTMLMMSVLGGFIAPIAKDLLVGLRRVRGK